MLNVRRGDVEEFLPFWTLDWHTGKMIKEYLSDNDNAAGEKIADCGTGTSVKKHNIYANLNFPIEIYRITLDLYNFKRYNETAKLEFNTQTNRNVYCLCSRRYKAERPAFP